MVAATNNTSAELVDPREIPTDPVDSLSRYKFEGTSAKVNFALDANPAYPGLEGRSDHHRGFINIGPSLDWLERAFDDGAPGRLAHSRFLGIWPRSP